MANANFGYDKIKKIAERTASKPEIAKNMLNMTKVMQNPEILQERDFDENQK